MITVRTARLILRRVEPADRAAFEAFYGNPVVMSVRKFGVLAPDAANAAFQRVLRHWEDHGFGICAIIDRASGAFAGECGLRWLEDRTDVELSYGLLPAFRGRGLATEAARAMLAHGFDALGLQRIVALSRGDNAPSHRVLEKLGMTLLWRRPRGRHGLVKYAIDAPGVAGVRPPER